MPSPFPGMDPYLEKRSLWPDLHQRLITYISEALQPQIRPKYLARIGEHIQLAATANHYVPDVLLTKPVRETAPTYATTMVDEPQIVAYFEAQQVPYIEIIYRDTGEVVTLIEVLSPANKVGSGRDQYLAKQDELLKTAVHLVEIDLLSDGRSTVLARNVIITDPPDWRYLVNISRAHRRWQLELYAIPLKERLPRCRIPLRPPDEDAVLDLTAVFTRCYDIGGYDLLIDYSRPPNAPLSEAESAWLTTLLKQRNPQ